MAVDALSGAAYNDVSKMKQVSKTEVSSQESGSMNVNVIETPVSKKNQTNQDQKQNSATDKQIKDAVSRANSRIRTNHKTSCEFSYHEETKSISIKVIDDDTSEVIREIPPKETLDMLAKMWELAGILVDEKR